jgi:YbbR domain-containing protein
MKRNWLYMVTGALLSIFLWVAVSADRAGEPTDYSADLFVNNGDERYVLTEMEPEQVTVRFTGTSFDLARLSPPEIRILIDSVTSEVFEVRLTWDMVIVKGRGGQELDVRAVRVLPDLLTLKFEPRAQKEVRVVPATHLINLADDYVMADSVRSEPGTVVVDGPESAVAAIDSVLTAPVPGERLRRSISVEVPLAEPEPSGLVELWSPTVLVTVSVEPRGERVIPGIPLAASGASAGGFRLEPSLVDVRISGPRSAVAAIRPEALAPRIQVSGPRDYGRMLPVIIDLPSPFMSVEVSPDSARVVPVESAG